MRTALILSLLALPGFAQAPPPLATVPASPVASMPFAVHVKLAACYHLTGVTVNGTNIDVTVAFEPLCITTPPFFEQTITTGPLAAGSYTLRLLRADDSSLVIATLPIAVTADVPTLDWRALAALAITLVGLALTRIR